MRSVTRKSLMLFLLMCLFVFGCVTSAKHLKKVSIGMTKEEVVARLDEPTVARGAIKNKFSQVVEVWEYKLALPSSDSAGQIIGKSAITLITFGMGAATFKGERRDYWLYFINDKLVQWGQAGDWQREADRIYEFNFNPQPSITK